MDPKELLKEFYLSEAFLKPEVMKKYIHPEIILEWNSSKGFLKLYYDDFLSLSKEMGASYTNSDILIKDIISEGEKTVVRYDHFVETVENRHDHVLLAHFIVIWTLKDGKLFSGYQMTSLDKEMAV